MSDSPGDRASAIVGMCEGEGFALAGASPLAPASHGSWVREWVRAGKHGEMRWLAETVEDRLDPTRVLPGARSAVVVADFYGARGAEPERPDVGAGRLARYARGRDYHDVIKRRLLRVCDRVRAAFPGCATRAFCDTAPVLERELAVRCGLGWVGKHTLLIHPAHGSWMLLGGFLTTLELAPPPGQRSVANHCGTCTRCIDACPTDAITPYSVDASRCVSYLTIEHAGDVPPSLAPGLEGWLVGCDVCQEVCPHNSGRPASSGAGVREEYRERRSGFDLLEVLGWDEPTRRARFATSAMKRVTLEQVKRNAALLLRERAGEPEVREGLEALAWDASSGPGARRAAREALDRRPDR